MRTIYIYLALLMWAKLLYFLRIYKQTGYLIRMLIQVVIDFKVFFLVLGITICGFANSFMILSNGSENNEDLVNGGFVRAFNFAFTLGLGDWDTGVYYESDYPISAWILFYLCTILVLIVMFNLLIAIISETFA